MNKYHLLFIPVACCLCPFQTEAQDFKEALLNMRQQYEASDNMHIEMQVTVFDDTSATNTFFQEKATIKRQNDSYYQVFGNMEMLMNARAIIVVNKAAKTITCNPRNLAAEALVKDPFQLNLDSILNFYQEPMLLSSEAGVDRYSLVQKQGPIRKLTLAIDTRSNQLMQLAYYYTQGQYVEIDFLVFDNQVQFPENTFSETKFFSFGENELRASPAYKGYEILNNGINF